MNAFKILLSAAMLAMPLLAAPAKADNVTANQLSAAGHGRRPTMTNRPSRQIYHRSAYGRPYHLGHRHRRGY